jgi:uncharacterized protein (DUF1778 family)
MFENLVPPSIEKSCSLAKEMKTLNDKDLKIFVDALDDPRWTHKALTAAVISRGFKTNEKALRAHRKKECLCSTI